MKLQKLLFAFLIFISSSVLFSCSKKADLNTGKTKSSADAGDVDLDLTQMSSSMIYSTVFNMLIMPDEYENKSIKVKGNFEVYENSASGERNYTVLIPDATACCQQGIGVIWEGQHSYPHDYPEIGQEIIITGVYTVTEDSQGITYTYLKVSNLE